MSREIANAADLNIQVFPRIDDSDNVGNKGLHKEEQNKFSQKVTSSGD